MPLAHGEQIRFTCAVGDVPNVPVVQVLQVVHDTDAALFCAWYVPSEHEAHACVLDTKENPAGQKLQLVSRKVFEV